jgi:hypothetical protein
VVQRWYANWYANQPDSGGVRGCTPTYAKRSDLQKLDTHEHRRTHCLNLGVKWSQIQILSARLSNRRSTTCDRPRSVYPHGVCSATAILVLGVCSPPGRQ